MKVILLQDVRAIGRKGEVREVSEGYAMNLLFPRKLAEPATEARIAAIEASRVAREKELLAQEEKLAADIRSLENARIDISARATEKGGLFKAIGSAEIARALAAQRDMHISESNIELSAPLKTTGEHPVTLRSKDVRANATVRILPQ